MIDKPGEDHRKEMRAIRDAVAIGDLKEIANQLLSMERLWVGKVLVDLLREEKQKRHLLSLQLVKLHNYTTAKKCPPYL